MLLNLSGEILLYDETGNILAGLCSGTIYTGVITLAWAYACWYAALRYLKPNVLGAFGYLSAAITFTLSLLVLKEKFSALFILAIILILSGMGMMMSNPAKDEICSEPRSQD